MQYQIRLILLSLWRNKFTSVINVICLTLGMLVAAIFICQANGAVESYNNYIRYMKLEDVFIANPLDYEVDKRIQIDELQNLKEEFDFVENVYAINRLSEENLQSKNRYLTGIGIYTIASDFDSNFNDGYLKKGSWINKTNDCVIGEKLVRKYQLEIGETIDIGATRYFITGIIRLSKYSSDIFINEKSVHDLKLFDCFYYIKTNSLSEENKDLLYTFILKNYGKHEINNKQDIINYEKRRLYSGWAPSIILAIIAFVYGILNIRNIEMFYLEQEKKTIAVMRAYGVQQHQVLFQRIVKACTLSFISSLLVYIIVYVLQFTDLDLIFDFYVDIKAYLVILIIGQIISITFSLFMTRKLLCKEVAVILRENI